MRAPHDPAVCPTRSRRERLGLCGGTQMLGDWIDDPQGLEGEPGRSRGLAIFEFETILKPRKVLRYVKGRLLVGSRSPAKGYEIQMGETTGAAMERPALELDIGTDGAVSGDDQVLGTYLQACSICPRPLLLCWLGQAFIIPERSTGTACAQPASIRLANAFEGHVDVERMLASARGFQKDPGYRDEGPSR